ncbi:MAG: hypothetical protein MZV63_22820 [Marinilabiliales bacterium]|nr:hypothetical protein [Marinilabiliales bacterium]
MKATILQCGLKWEERDANLAHISSLLDSAAPGSGIVVLPEMFTTGFTMNPAPLAEDDGRPHGQVDEGAGRCRRLCPLRVTHYQARRVNSTIVCSSSQMGVK